MSRLCEFSDELENLLASAAPSVVAVEHGHGQGSGIIVSGDLAPRAAEGVGQKRALRVQGVASDSPASLARIKAADLLLCANDSPLYSVDDLQRVLVLSRGSEILLRVRRDGQPVSLSVTPQLKRNAA